MTEEMKLPREAGSGPIFHPDWGTHAYADYNAGITNLNALLGMVFPIDADTPRSLRLLEGRRLRIENDFSGPWGIDVQYSMLSWQVAMRVSAVEAYLQDALTFLAVYDDEFIRSRKSLQQVDYDSIRSSSDYDRTLFDFCSRWARNFVGDGGPRRWIESLRGAGLGRFGSTNLSQLESMWGYRHVRIHNGGRLTPEFATRHPEVTERLGEHGLTLSDFEAWSKEADSFVGEAESGIAGRLRARLGETLVAARERAEFDRQVTSLRERYEALNKDLTENEINERIARQEAEFEARVKRMDEPFEPDDPRMSV